MLWKPSVLSPTVLQSLIWSAPLIFEPISQNWIPLYLNIFNFATVNPSQKFRIKILGFHLFKGFFGWLAVGEWGTNSGLGRLPATVWKMSPRSSLVSAAGPARILLLILTNQITPADFFGHKLSPQCRLQPVMVHDAEIEPKEGRETSYQNFALVICGFSFARVTAFGSLFREY